MRLKRGKMNGLADETANNKIQMTAAKNIDYAKDLAHF
jgi:hypothetical protein